MPARTRVLSRRQLNRALLARQLLLERSTAGARAAIEQVGGLQAQLARPPFVGLWSRVSGFTREALAGACLDRSVVRVTAMRGTLHLLSARDYRAWRGALQPALDKGIAGIVGDALEGMDLPAAERETRRFLGARPATFEALRAHLAPLFPDVNVRLLAYAVRLRLPLVQLPDAAHPWGYPGSAAFAVADDWLGAPVSTAAASPDRLVRRYLAAFGPATAADAQAWSGLPALGPALASMRDELVSFQDEHAREFFDLPDAPRPDEDVEPPVRFLPEFDSVVLAHQDRGRVVSDEHRKRISTKNLQVAATVLVDGMVAGSWTVSRTRRSATLTVVPFVKIAAKQKAALVAEGEALLAFMEPASTSRTVTFAA